MQVSGISRMVGLIALTSILLACPDFSQAQPGNLNDLFSKKSQRSEPSKPKFTVTLSPETASPGDEVTLSISVKLPKGYYIYSTTGEFGGRTKIQIEPPENLEPIDEEFVPDHEPKVAFEPLLNVEVGKFFDAVTWSRKYRVVSGSGEAVFTGKLTGQYCSGPEAETQQCIPITPPYQFEATVALAEGTTDSTGTSSGLVYSRHVQPVKNGKSSEQPLPIAYDFSMSPTDAKPGEVVTLALHATMQEGWHTFSLSQASLGGQPTVIEVLELDGLEVVDDQFQAEPEFVVEELEDLKLEVHHQDVTWRKAFRVLPDVTPGHYGIAGKIRNQTCKEGTCLPATKVTFALGTFPEDYQPATGKPAENATSADNPLVEAATETQSEPHNETAIAANEVPAVAKSGPDTNVEQPQALVPFLLLCLGGGFLALLTPCSFPMVPITVSFFLKQSEAQHKRPWLLALIYCGSIIAAFTFLGVVISAVFGAAGVNQLATNPWLNLVVGLIFVVFSLDMLGLYEFHMPGWLLTWSASKEGTGSYFGAVFMAMTFTLTSFTCTFPLAGGFLVLASKGEYYWPTIGMMAFGTGFALPFLAISAIPGALKKLPKSGGWMTTIKVVLGLLELGAATKFLSMGDPRGFVFDHVMVMVIWLVLALCTGMYLLGLFRLPHDGTATQISAGRMLWASAFFVLAGFLTVGLFAPHAGGGWIMNQIIALAPPRIEADVVGNDAGPANREDLPQGLSISHHGVRYSLEIEEAVAFAKAHNKPLFLDFTGWWCVNCREMEKRMADSAWFSKVESMVRVQLYLDQTPPNVPAAQSETLLMNNEAWRAKFFDQNSMPMYAIVTPDGETALETYVGSETPDKAGSFAKFLEAGRRKWEALQASREVPRPTEIRLAGE